MIGKAYRSGGSIRAAILTGHCMANKFRASGEGGSLSLITRPIVRRAVGSTSSIARVPFGTPKKRSNWRGTMADQRPALTWETRLKIEFVSTAGTGLAPTERK